VFAWEEMLIPFGENDYGFTWGAATIERTASISSSGVVIITLRTPKQELQIYVTKSGKVRIFERSDEWVKGGDLMPKATKKKSAARPVAKKKAK